MEVLRVLNRESVYEIKVIDVPQAFSGLYGKAVLFISLPVLRLLRAEELQAIVAHEVGHEYLWEEYEVAQKRMDNQRLRELEIACDAIAVLILSRLGLPSDRLTDALDKLSRFNHGRFGAALNESSYPSLEDRRRAMKRLTAVRLSWPK
jgi:Zn-dependent protease with chaperone function